MDVTLRSGKELDKHNKSEKDEKKVEQKNLEIEEKIEAEKNKAGVWLNNKGNEQKSVEVVSGRKNFPDNPPLYTQPFPFP